MPEGPEVRVIVEQLNSQVRGRTIQSIEIVGGRYARKGPPPGFDHLPDAPLLIKSVSSKGKFIYFSLFTLGEDWHIFNTLGMSGTWSVDPVNVRYKHGHVRFHLDDGNVMTFIDTRNFGTLKFSPGYTELNKKLDELGWDPLRTNEVPEAWILKRVFKKPNRNVTEILMDQKIFAGVGNYIKAEVLYRAQISPHRKAFEIQDMEWINLCDQIRAVVSESLAAKGTTIRDYRDALGESGSFQNFLRVYGRKVDPGGNSVVRETTPDKRTTHWVPEIQK